MSQFTWTRPLPRPIRRPASTKWFHTNSFRRRRHVDSFDSEGNDKAHGRILSVQQNPALPPVDKLGVPYFYEVGFGKCTKENQTKTYLTSLKQNGTQSYKATLLKCMVRKMAKQIWVIS